jgi:hypothetical protein
VAAAAPPYSAGLLHATAPLELPSPPAGHSAAAVTLMEQHTSSQPKEQ